MSADKLQTNSDKVGSQKGQHRPMTTGVATIVTESKSGKQTIRMSSRVYQFSDDFISAMSDPAPGKSH